MKNSIPLFKLKSVALTLGTLCTALAALAQYGRIKGTVYSADQQPAPYVLLKIKETSRQVEADKQGHYEFRNLEAGSYTLTATAFGLKVEEETVSLEANESLTLNFKLTGNTNQLQEVVIGGKGPHQSDYVAKMPLDALENPQVYNSISGKIMEQQAITNFDDALNNAPGIRKLWESTGRGSDGAAYYALRGFEAQATVINGIPGLTNGSLDPANIERIEVLKGPSSTLFGSSLISYGGLINTVTKKPYDHFGGEVTYTTGSFGLNRVTADLNVPISGGLSVRTNAAFHSEQSFQDAGFRKAVFLAPSLRYKVNDRLTFLLNTEFLQEEKTNPTMLFLGRNSPLQWADLDALNYNSDLSLTNNSLSVRNPRYNIQAQMHYQLSAAWQSQTILSSGYSGATGYYSYLYDNENGKKEFALWITNQQGSTRTLDLQQNFTGDFMIGSVRNRVLLGIDIFEQNNSSNGTGWAWVHNVNAQGAVNYTDPETGDSLAPRYLNPGSIDNILANKKGSFTNHTNRTYSAYVSDVINLHRKLLVMASLRADLFDNGGDITQNDDGFNQFALSPKFGVVYQPIRNQLAVFANYMNGFKNVAPGEVADPDGENPRIKTFEPEHANQVEFGIKANLFSNKLTATLSTYDIRVSNVVTADPQNQFNRLQGGSIESRGFELDLQANPVKGLHVLAGFSYNDSKVIKGDEANIWLETGRRPISSGPETMANFWASYECSGVLRGLGFGFGGNYSGELLILDSKVTGTFALPAYTVFNAAIFYARDKFRLGLNLNNFTNEEYYTGYSTINPQKPRNITASIAFRF